MLLFVSFIIMFSLKFFLVCSGDDFCFGPYASKNISITVGKQVVEHICCVRVGNACIFNCPINRVIYTIEYINIIDYTNCCDNYIKDNDKCIPHCETECQHGKCDAPNFCNCDDGYTGSSCETSLCETSPCLNNGLCVGHDMCNCAGTGYEGSNCEQDTDECSSGVHDCKEGCLNTLGSYSCVCNNECFYEQDGNCLIKDEYCFIDNVCYQSDAISNNGCKVCDPLKSTSNWVNREQGNSCDDGVNCTSNDQCEFGECIGDPYTCDECEVCDGNGTCDLVNGCSTVPPPGEISSPEDVCKAGIYHPVPHLYDRHKFYLCVRGNPIPYEMHCPASLVFDPSVGVCNWPTS